jgi:hypothetical protein
MMHLPCPRPRPFDSLTLSIREPVDHTQPALSGLDIQYIADPHRRLTLCSAGGLAGGPAVTPDDVARRVGGLIHRA